MIAHNDMPAVATVPTLNDFGCLHGLHLHPDDFAGVCSRIAAAVAKACAEKDARILHAETMAGELRRLLRGREAELAASNAKMVEIANSEAEKDAEIARLKKLVTEHHSSFINQLSIERSRIATLGRELAQLKEENRALRAITENDSWSGEMQDALDAIPRQFQQSDYWVNGIKRMATSHAALEQEIVRLNPPGPSVHLVSELENRIAAMERELATAREDSARLDWLEKTDGEVHSDMGYGDGPSTWYAYRKKGNVNDTQFECLSGSTIRVAIDAARAGHGETAK